MVGPGPDDARADARPDVPRAPAAADYLPDERVN